MRRPVVIVGLVLAAAFFAAFPAIQEKMLLAELKGNRSYEAALYYAHVLAVDSTTSQQIQFRLRWDAEVVSPFSKGSGPTVVETLSDGSKILSAVGVARAEPLRVEVSAVGYQSEFIGIEPQGGGVLTQDASRLLQKITLTPTIQADDPSPKQ